MLNFSVGVTWLLKCKPDLSSFNTSNKTGKAVLLLFLHEAKQMQKITAVKQKI